MVTVERRCEIGRLSALSRAGMSSARPKAFASEFSLAMYPPVRREA
jgi:hypothetical protein